MRFVNTARQLASRSIPGYNPAHHPPLVFWERAGRRSGAVYGRRISRTTDRPLGDHRLGGQRTQPHDGPGPRGRDRQHVWRERRGERVQDSGPGAAYPVRDAGGRHGQLRIGAHAQWIRRCRAAGRTGPHCGPAIHLCRAGARRRCAPPRTWCPTAHARPCPL